MHAHNPYNKNANSNNIITISTITFKYIVELHKQQKRQHTKK